VIAKVEWHPGELYPRVGFIVTNLSRPAERVVAFYNKRGTAAQWIKEGKGAVKWTRLSCRTFPPCATGDARERLARAAIVLDAPRPSRTMGRSSPIRSMKCGLFERAIDAVARDLPPACNARQTITASKGGRECLAHRLDLLWAKGRLPSITAILA
jgi:hypothetical protein